MSWLDKVKQQIKGEVSDLVKKGKAIKAAAIDLHSVTKGEAQLKDVVAKQGPKLQGYVRRVGPRWYRLIYDDNAAKPALYTAYARMPLAWFVPAERFVGFCLDHRDTLLGVRELRIEAMRETIEGATRDAAQVATLAAHVAGLHRVSVLDPRVAAEASMAVKLAESVPELLASTARAARAAGRFDALFPVLQEIEYHVLTSPGPPPADTAAESPTPASGAAETSVGLLRVIQSSYLALSLIQTLSDRGVARSLGPLIDLDLRPARTSLAGVIGPGTEALDTAVGKIIDESDFMARVGKVVGAAIPVIAVASALASLAGAGAAPSGDAAAGVNQAASAGGEWVSSNGISAADHAISNAYTGALFGSDCVARF